MTLKAEFESFYKTNYSDIQLLYPVFYTFPIGIRFEMGRDDQFDWGSSKKNNKKELSNYLAQALFRATSIFKELFNDDDTIYIVINSFEDDPNDLADSDISVVRPLIENIREEYSYDFVSADGDFSCKRFVLCTEVKAMKTEELLDNIICSDIYGMVTLSSCVYIFNKRSGVLYYLYDDSGLDIVANKKEKLLAVYNKYNNWILAYDRKQIEKMFTE